MPPSLPSIFQHHLWKPSRYHCVITKKSCYFSANSRAKHLPFPENASPGTGILFPGITSPAIKSRDTVRREWFSSRIMELFGRKHICGNGKVSICVATSKCFVGFPRDCLSIEGPVF
ncbi:hypothetical protein JTE90_014640 [Oedothorax gibbosus]|uniref:Uncharacterized protein n=1 Tax=Oedothorax gibbosus TaxID=931172 RepID=A0AAV6VA78_9ARAC|nr:hypothetical protein JTE90_014640 [Oedothorax gibbosus]